MLRNVLIVLCLLVVQGLVLGNNTMYPPINDTTPGFSAKPGGYDATQVSVPLGPYHISFSTRLENVTCEGEYRKSDFNKSAGSGKDYRICTYDLGTLRVLRNSTAQRGNVGSAYPTAELTFTIYRYVAPSSYPPENPDPNGYLRLSTFYDSPTLSRDISDPEQLIIDGKRGTLMSFWYTNHNTNVVYPSESYDRVGDSDYIAAYQPGDKTFVVLKTSGVGYDRDVALVLQTLHITE